MVEVINSISSDLILYLGQQTLSSLPLILLVIFLGYFFPDKAPRLKYAFCVLLLLRLLIPLNYDYGQIELDPSTYAPLKLVADATAMPEGSSPPILSTEPPAEVALSLTSYLVIVWGLGTLFLLLRFWRTRYSLVEKIRRGDRLETDRYDKLIDKWRRIIGLRQRITVIVTSDTEFAFSTGILRPNIYLPAGYSEMGDSETELILAHECAHINRYDDLALIIQQIATSIFFFNPLIWVASRIATLSREQTCDRLVTEKGQMPHDQYARVLIKSVRRQITETPYPAFNSNGFQIRDRIKCIISKGQLKTGYGVLLVMVAILLSQFSLSFGVMTVSEQATIPSTEKSTVPTKSFLMPDIAFVSPIPLGRVSTHFGKGSPGETKHGNKQTAGHHHGVDIRAEVGSKVFAAADGTVVGVIKSKTGQELVIIDHGDNWLTLYNRLSSIAVYEGTLVEQGDLLGSVGERPEPALSHLHFEIRHDGADLDPGLFIDFGQ